MNIFQWNIDKGGPKPFVDKIASIATHQSPEVIVLSEFRKDRPELEERLDSHGYHSHIPLENSRSGNQVAIFSKPTVGLKTNADASIPHLEGLTILCESVEINVMGVFFPEKGPNKASLHSFVDWLSSDPLSLASKPTVLAGDFNHGVIASEWNKGKVGREHKYISEWIKQGQWNDPFSNPLNLEDYPPTFQRNRTAIPESEQKWLSFSSRPDHFFFSNFVRPTDVRVLPGYMAKGYSDHEPMIGNFVSTSKA